MQQNAAFYHALPCRRMTQLRQRVCQVLPVQRTAVAAAVNTPVLLFEVPSALASDSGASPTGLDATGAVTASRHGAVASGMQRSLRAAAGAGASPLLIKRACFRRQRGQHSQWKRKVVSTGRCGVPVSGTWTAHQAGSTRRRSRQLQRLHVQPEWGQRQAQKTAPHAGNRRWTQWLGSTDPFRQ